MPKVSVIMGVYNGAHRVERAVESIIRQTFDDFEFIICDDGSSDGTDVVLEKLSFQDNRIIILKNGKNLGLAQTLNNCLAVAKGEYIARMDDDDISHPTRFEEQVSFLDSHPEYAVVGTSCNLYDENGVWGTSVVCGERSKLDIFMGRSFAHPSVMMRKEAVLKVGGYTVSDITLRTEDYDLWCKLYFEGFKGYNLSNTLLDYYEGRDSYVKRKYRYRVDEYRLRKHWINKLELPVRYRIHIYRPLIVGLLPGKIITTYHRYKFRQR